MYSFTHRPTHAPALLGGHVGFFMPPGPTASNPSARTAALDSGQLNFSRANGKMTWIFRRRISTAKGAFHIMSDAFEELYRYMRLAHYKRLFSAIHEKSGSLTATEAASVEVIYLLDRPTVNEFARFLNISQPNATYKINALVEKGYIIKLPCKEDRRECRLAVTQKFMDYYAAQTSDLLRAAASSLTDAERDALSRLVVRMAELARQRGELDNPPRPLKEAPPKKGRFRKMREALSRKSGVQRGESVDELP